MAVTVSFTAYAESVGMAFDRICAGKMLSRQKRILIKPNLITAAAHPVTTHPDCCRAVIEYIRAAGGSPEIVIAEGIGDPSLTARAVFDQLGYSEMARQLGVKLVDLDDVPVTTIRKAGCSRFPEMTLPEIAFDSYLISLPVLKAHSFSAITGSMKNMIGIAPARYYAGGGGIWKKAVFHDRIHQAIVDLNQYRTPDLTLMDASIGMPDFHLGGRTCDPPVNKLIAGYDAKAVDRESAGLLGLDWKRIAHLA